MFQLLQLAKHATLDKVHPRVVAASGAVQNVHNVEHTRRSKRIPFGLYREVKLCGPVHVLFS